MPLPLTLKPGWFGLHVCFNSIQCMASRLELSRHSRGMQRKKELE